ncbi:chromosomal replication initiator protein DnaA [Candidatus Collierbacteria bacterium]|nr:chromosomal replication initiator protein DnaA [Candidatus Collierbacteria bacterium]
MNLSKDELWRSVCGEMELSVSEASYSAWIKPCFVKSITAIDGERVIVELATPSSYHLRTIDERYYGQIKQTLEKLTEKKCELALVVKQKEGRSRVETGEESGEQNLFNQEVAVVVGTGVGLNPRFSFESYVVGGSNNLAYAAARAVADLPGVRHNPLFLWGGVGVGKTHLMQAVGHALVKKGIKQVAYVTSEQFTNDLIDSFRNKTTDSFKKKYRQVGALLVDDIQFFAGKETSQEEFFHTFNDLYMKGVQMVFTSDRKPQEIAQVEQRLISRFLGGLTVDIGLPDYEMRVAILKQKSAELKINVSDQIVALIANNVMTNAREMEGIFVRLVNAASLEGGMIDEDLVEKVVGVKEKQERKNIRPIKIISVVAKQFDFRNKDLLGKSRKAELVKARHIAMFLLREELGMQLTKVGELMGGRDHTTVMHAVEKIEQEFDVNQEIRSEVIKVKQSLYLN